MSLRNYSIHVFTAVALMLLTGVALVGSPPWSGEVRSMIVQGSDLAAVRSAVEAVGGEITHELGVINAVGAVLTESQRVALAELEGIRRLYSDRSLGVNSAGPTQLVRDDFTPRQWDGNDGTVDTETTAVNAWVPQE